MLILIVFVLKGEVIMKSTVKESKYVVKGAAPWYNNSNDAKYRWPDRDKVTDVDVSVSGQATVICKEVTDMSLMFFDCPRITKLDVSNLNTSKVTNMNDMFNNCPKLTELNLSGFDTSKVTSMRTMFNYCPGLTKLDVSGFNTSKVTNMYSMFNRCSRLTKLDLSGFNTAKVIYMNFMFDNCSKLTELDLSGFVTSKVTNMSYMFDNCSNLTTIKGVLDMKSCEYYENMFHNCPKLRGVKIKNPPVDFESVSGLSNSQYIVVS